MTNLRRIVKKKDYFTMDRKTVLDSLHKKPAIIRVLRMYIVSHVVTQSSIDDVIRLVREFGSALR